MNDNLGQKIRERIWVTKVDKSVDPPMIVEEVFVENGKLVSVTRQGDIAREDEVSEDSHE